jgi:putative holliday junction resolvase
MSAIGLGWRQITFLFRIEACGLQGWQANSKGIVEGRLRPLLSRRDGSGGPPRAQSTRAFACNFALLTTLPIGLWDERLSTSAVERELIANDVSRARRAKIIDEHAAILILQGALDRLAKLRGEH